MTTTVTIAANQFTAAGPIPLAGRSVTFKPIPINIDSVSDTILSEDAWEVPISPSGLAETLIPDSQGGYGVRIMSSIEGWQIITVANYPVGTISLPDLVNNYAVNPETLEPIPAPDAWWTALNNLVNNSVALANEYTDEQIDLAKAYTDDEIDALNVPSILPAANAYTDAAVEGIEVDVDPEVAALVASASATQTALDARYGLADEYELNVKRYGAKGDGTTDDTAALQAVLDLGAGRTVYVPRSTDAFGVVKPYMVNGNADTTNHIGLKMTKAGTRLLLDPGAILKVITNSLTNYVLISVTAADCSIVGGTLQGDVATHTGSTGEWGHVLAVDTGADRFTLRGTTVKEAWGDGLVIQRGPADVLIDNIIADSNRRQGMSITGSTRTRVNGGVFKNTGLIGATAPAAGIDVEPNPSSGYSVTDCVISDAIAYNNAGPGFMTIRATAQTTDVQFNNCRASGNGTGLAGVFYSGFHAAGSAGTGRTRFSDCVAVGNFLHGFYLYADGAEATNCRARGNTQNGFELVGGAMTVALPNAEENGRHGIHVASTANDARILGGSSGSNSQVTTNTYSNVSVDAAGNVRIDGHLSAAGSLTNKPKYGYEILTGAGVRAFGCDITGSFGTGNYVISSTSATFLPLPGFTKAAAIASPTADVTALKTAVDALRAAVFSLGMTS